MLEPLEFKFAKDNAKPKDKVLPGPCILAWEKSPRLSKSKPIDSADGKVVWPPAPQTHPLQLIITMYKKDNKFLSKKTSLKARIVTPKGEEKTVGKCEIDVANYCVDKEISHPPIDLKMGGDCVMRCRIHSRPIQPGAGGGEGGDISMMSGLSNVEEPSAVSDWAAGFGKNKGPDSDKKKGALDSDDEEDDDDDDDDDFGGFGTKKGKDQIKNDKKPALSPKPEDSDDEFVGIDIPNAKDDPTIMDAPSEQGPEVDQVEISKVMQAEIVPTSPNIDIKPPTTINVVDDGDLIANMAASTDHTQCEEFIGKYKVQVDQLLRENETYHDQLKLLQTQHSADIERFQGIVTLSQTSLNKMQDVVAEYKKREEGFQLQLTTLQTKVKADEKQFYTENKRLIKENQIHQQDITILNSKITTLKENIKHKEEAEQRLVIQMKSTGDTESILLGEKTQLETKLKDSEANTKTLKIQLEELIKDRDGKQAQVVEIEKELDKVKQSGAEFEKQCTALKVDLANEREKSLVQAQQLAQFEHTIAVKDKEIAGYVVVGGEKDKEIVQLKTQITQSTNSQKQKDDHLASILKQFESLQDQVYKLEAECVGLKEQNEGLVGDNKTRKDQYDKLQSDLQKTTATNTNKDAQTQALQQQLTALQASVAAFEAAKIVANDKEKKYQEQINILSQEKSKLSSQFSSTTTDLTKSRDENKSLVMQIEQLQADLKAEKDRNVELQGKFDSINPQLETANKLNIDLKATIASAEANNVKVQGEKGKLEGELKELRDQIVELEHDNAEFKNTRIPALEKAIKEHKTVIETNMNQIERKEAEVIALSAALESIKATKTPTSPIAAPSSFDQSMVLEEGYERISTTELARIRDEIGFLTTTLDKRTDKIEKLNEEIERLHEEHEEFLQMRQQMEEDFNELEHERDELDQKLNVLTTKFEVLSQQNEKIKSNQSDIDQTQVKKLHEELDSVNEQYRQVKERNEQVKAEASKLKNELNHAESLVTDLNTKLNITETKLENSEANCKNVLEKSTELAAQLNTELTRAHLENRSLRDRIHTFDTLTATVTAIISGAPQLKGAKLESRVVEELIGKIDYYQSQLAEADETLLQTKQTWKQTSDVLTRRILDVEDQLKKLQKDKMDLEHARGQDEGEQSKMKTTLSQQQQQREKYQEALSKFEIQLIAKRVEITELTKERDMYREQVEMYENNVESYQAQLNASRVEVEQLRETLAAVSGQGKKGKKSKRSQQQQQDYDLDDADF